LKRFSLNIFYKLINWFGYPGRFSMQKFIKDNSYCPNITFRCIRLSLEYLSWHVERCANRCFIFHFSAYISFGEPEICNFHDPFRNQYVCRFDISFLSENYLWIIPSLINDTKPFTMSFNISIAFSSAIGAFDVIMFYKSLSQSYWIM